MEMNSNPSDSTEQPEGPQVIVEVGAEGGSVTLQGILSPKGWIFQVVTGDSALMSLIDEEVPSGTVRPWVLTWRSALKQLDAYPWPHLFPLKVHPDFRHKVDAALKVRQKRGEINWDQWGYVLKGFDTQKN